VASNALYRQSSPLPDASNFPGTLDKLQGSMDAAVTKVREVESYADILTCGAAAQMPLRGLRNPGTNLSESHLHRGAGQSASTVEDKREEV